MKHSITSLIILLMLIMTGCSNNYISEYSNSSLKEIEYSYPADSIKSTIESLPEVRALGSNGEKDACAILEKKLTDYNYEVKLQKIKYKMSDNDFAIEAGKTFPANLKKIAEGETNNIIAKNKQYDSSKKDIVITAHYDTTSFPGANDNASGVAVLMEIAKKVGIIKNYNLIFVLFSGEENLLLGSEYFVEHLSDAEKNNISAVINLDTLSGNAEPEITFAGQSYTKAYYLFENVFKNFFSVNLNPPYSSGDEIHFENAGIPALSIGQEGENLHTNKDVVENLDMDDLVCVFETLYTALKSMG